MELSRILGIWKRAIFLIASTRVETDSPLFQAEVTKLYALLSVEIFTSLLTLAFALHDWIAGVKIASIIEVLFAVFLLTLTPYFRLRYKPDITDNLELLGFTVLLLVLAYTVFPLDAMVAPLVAIYPPFVFLLKRKKGLKWVIFFLPLHFIFTWAGATGIKFSFIAWLKGNIPSLWSRNTFANVWYVISGSYLLYVIVTLLSFALTTIIEGFEESWKKAASEDRLTGALNRFAFEEMYRKYYTISIGEQKKLSIILMDIDNFKKINDTFGHNSGDAVLKELVRLIENGIRAEDKIVRWGGEEFLILAPDTELGEAYKLAERIRTLISEHNFPIPGEVTVTLGVAERKTGETFEQLVFRADKALYRGKQNGKNRVEIG